MDSNARGRSPSAGKANNHLRHAPSASPHPPFETNSYGLGSNISNPTNDYSTDHFAGLNPNLTSGQFIDPSFTQDFQQQAQYSLHAQDYNNFQEQQHQQTHQQNQDIASHTFLQSAQGGNNPGFDWNQSANSSNHVSPGAYSQHTSPTGLDSAGTSSFPSFDFNQPSFDQNGSLDPALLGDIDPNGLDLVQPQQQLDSSLDPMMAATMHPHTPTPPHLLPGTGRRQSASPSPHASPNIHSAHFQQAMSRPRNTSETLDPSSAAYPQGQGNEWVNMGGYRGHHRSPSDQLSDISSAHNSPYMQTLDSFDNGSHSSPMLNPSSDPAFNDGLGLGGFSLNDTSSQQSFHSPGHSPHISPSLMPQQSPLPPYTAADNFGLNHSNQFGQQQNPMDMYPINGQEPFPSLSQGNSPGDLGAADQMSPPEISIHYAPPAPQRNNFDSAPRQPNAEDTLSPPLRAPSRNRMRAKSDTFIPRPPTPSSGRGRSPSLQPQASTDSLSPFPPQPSSRSTSPASAGRGRASSIGSGRGRSSSGASDQRDYILDLANPERTPSNDPSNRRQQKHPATFQCTLCPKRFTRAYNLRSHLRTHTDERPFVCTVCGKAFARQHDRKRHEGLHSGEKKFVCRGSVQNGNQWGCGRRFARADALGRHFRSEAGRVCIKPLLDEEAAERQKAWMEEQAQAQVAAGLVAPQPMLQQPQMQLMDSFLPAALLQQYPALAGLDWNSIPQGPPGMDEEDMEGGISGRSSFEASSGGDFDEGISENEMGYARGNGMGYGMPQQQQGVYGNQAGDYMNGFEGR